MEGLKGDFLNCTFNLKHVYLYMWENGIFSSSAWLDICLCFFLVSFGFLKDNFISAIYCLLCIFDTSTSHASPSETSPEHDAEAFANAPYQTIEGDHQGTSNHAFGTCHGHTSILFQGYCISGKIINDHMSYNKHHDWIESRKNTWNLTHYKMFIPPFLRVWTF